MADMTSLAPGAPTGRPERVAVIGAGVSGLTAAYLLPAPTTSPSSRPRTGSAATPTPTTSPTPTAGGTPSTAGSSSTTTAPTPAAQALRRARRARSGHRDEHERPLRRLRAASTPAAAGRAACSPSAAALLDPRFVRMLLQVKRFHRRASAFLRTTDDEDLTTYGEFLDARGVQRATSSPTTPCRSSRACGPPARETALDYPARYLFRFLEHHGMLTGRRLPAVVTVVGGSRTYVERARRAAARGARRSTRSPTSRARSDGVEIRDPLGRHRHLRPRRHRDCTPTRPSACSPTRRRREGTCSARSATRSNETVLHTRRLAAAAGPRARASWNYLVGTDPIAAAPSSRTG